MTVIIKKLRELSINELGDVVVPYGDKITDYETFQVRKNNKGLLLGVKPYEYTKAKKKEINRQRYNSIDLVDCLAANFETLTGCKPWKTLGVKGAKKRVHYALANQEIRERKEISKNKKKTLAKSN